MSWVVMPPFHRPSYDRPSVPLVGHGCDSPLAVPLSGLTLMADEQAFLRLH